MFALWGLLLCAHVCFCQHRLILCGNLRRLTKKKTFFLRDVYLEQAVQYLRVCLRTCFERIIQCLSLLSEIKSKVNSMPSWDTGAVNPGFKCKLLRLSFEWIAVKRKVRPSLEKSMCPTQRNRASLRCNWRTAKAICYAPPKCWCAMATCYQSRLFSSDRSRLFCCISRCTRLYFCFVTYDAR